MTRAALRRQVPLVVACVCLSPVLVACGGSERVVTYSTEAAQQLRTDVARVRAAAEDRRHRAARVALHRLTRHVAAAQASGELPAAKARRILSAADLVAADIAALPDKNVTGRDGQTRFRRQPTGDRGQDPGPDRHDRAGHAGGGEHRAGDGAHRDAEPHHDDGGEKPEGWEAHKGAGGEGEKPEGWEAHKKED